jgi:ubiquinone/menaquinone biosynthesis C-methylase UbiE
MKLKFNLYFSFARFLQNNMTSAMPNNYSSSYDRMRGNCTRLVASQMVSSVSPPINSTSYILDNACGPGIMSEKIKLLHPDVKIMATDISPVMIEEMQKRTTSEGWTNIQTGVMISVTCLVWLTTHSHTFS